MARSLLWKGSVRGVAEATGTWCRYHPPRGNLARRVLTRNGRNDPAAEAPTLGDPRARGRKLGAARLQRGHADGAARLRLGPETLEGHLYHLDIYSHLKPDMQEKVAKALEEALG